MTTCDTERDARRPDRYRALAGAPFAACDGAACDGCSSSGTTLDSGAGAVALDVPAGEFYVELEIGTVRELSMVAARVLLAFSAQ